MKVWLYVTLAVLIDGLAGLVGGLLPERVMKSRQSLVLGFAAGILVGVAFLDLLPEALTSAGLAAMRVALGTFVAMAVLEWWLGHGRNGHAPSAGASLLLGSDAVHNVADGAAIAAAFLASSRLGVVTALAVVIHEVPEEVGAYAVLRSAGMTRTKTLQRMAAVQLTAGIGAVLTLAGTRVWSGVSGLVLSVAGGSFLYIGATDLLPPLVHAREKQSKAEAVAGLVAGVAVSVAMTLS